MGEPKGQRNPEQSIQAAIMLWEHMDIQPKTNVFGEPKPAEEIFAEIDQMQEQSVRNEEHAAEQLDSGETANLHCWFSPRGAVATMRGETPDAGSIYRYLPYYANSRFSNAWKKMCTDPGLRGDVERITRFEEERDSEPDPNRRRGATEEERESLKKVSIFLRQQGLSASLICG